MVMLSSHLIAPPSRRALLRSLSGSGLLLFVDSLATGADFWNKKDAASWSADEVEQIKTKSPWAKRVHAEMAGVGGGRGGGGDSMDSGGSRGSFGGMSG